MTSDACTHARASLEGLSVGDALGERFFRPSVADARFLLSGDPPRGPWAWTDDTAQAVALLDHITRCGEVQVDALAQDLAAMYAWDPRRGYGGGAHDILSRIGAGEPWLEVAGAAFGGAGSMGNGAAMRVTPLGAWFSADLAVVVEQARRSARPTHTHAEAGAFAAAAAVAAALAATTTLRGAAFIQAVRDHTPDSLTRDKLDQTLRHGADASPQEVARAVGNGGTVLGQDTVPFCVWCAASCIDDYPVAIAHTISVMGDVDTTCAIVGGIVAARTGLDGIPQAWRERREPLPVPVEITRD